ncbi:MAG: pilin [Patescibacteria group bacterium]
MIRKILLMGFFITLLASPAVVSTNSYALDGGAEAKFKEGLDKAGANTTQDCKDAGGEIKSGKCVDSDGKTIEPVAFSLKNVINILLFISGIIAVVYVVIGGFRYVTSNGDSGSISKAKNTIMYALIGLVIAIMAYAIVNFVLGKLKL